MHWAIDPEDRPFGPSVAPIGGQAPICAALFSNNMSEGTANNIAVVSWLFLAMGGYDRRFALPYPRDFLARVQMIGKVDFAFSASAGVDMPNPGATKKERDDYLLSHSALAGQNVAKILAEYQKQSSESLRQGEVVRGWSPGGSQAPSPPNTPAPQVDLTLVEIAGGKKQLGIEVEFEVEGSMGLWGGFPCPTPERPGEMGSRGGGGTGGPAGGRGPGKVWGGRQETRIMRKRTRISCRGLLLKPSSPLKAKTLWSVSWITRTPTPQPRSPCTT